MPSQASGSGAIARSWGLLIFRVAALLSIVLVCSGGSSAYSVLTHEEIVDLLWTPEIQPLLLKRFPTLSTDQRQVSILSFRRDSVESPPNAPTQLRT